MFKKLLVPLDGTAESAVALPLARTVARATGAEVRLVRVVRLQAVSTEGERDVAAESLKRVADELGTSGLRVESVVHTAREPADAILQEVRACGADLVVMATHGRAGLARAVLGSVAERIVAESPVPILLLRPGGHQPTRFRRLLVPVDETPGGGLALGLAVPLARETGAEIVLLEVVVPIAPYGGVDPELTGPAWDDEALASAGRYVTTLGARLQRAGISAEGRAVVGYPGEAIVRTAHERGADIIVMSTHALTGIARALLRSTADEVVRGAECPVLLVHRR
jgi:nucleotide-binding universal stress UspA family protein